MCICSINNTYSKRFAKSCLSNLTRFYKAFQNIFQSLIGKNELQFAYLMVEK